MADTEEPFDEPGDDDAADLRIVLRLSNNGLGTGAERKAIEALGEQLDTALTEADAGEFEGEEVGGGQCILFFAAPDRELTIDVVRKVLVRFPLAREAHFEFEAAQPDGTMQRRQLPL